MRLRLDRDDAKLRLSDVLNVVRTDEAGPEGSANLWLSVHGP